MRILDKLIKRKNKLVQPEIIVEDSFTITAADIGKVINIPANRSISSTWFADPKSSTGRRYRVHVNGEMGTVEASGETLAVAIEAANKKYDKKEK